MYVIFVTGRLPIHARLKIALYTIVAFAWKLESLGMLWPLVTDAKLNCDTRVVSSNWRYCSLCSRSDCYLSRDLADPLLQRNVCECFSKRFHASTKLSQMTYLHCRTVNNVSFRL